MIKIRSKIAFLLLAIYSVVFAHNIIPHHHHLDFVDNLVAVFCPNDLACHHHDCNDVHAHNGPHSHSHTGDAKLKHSHEHEPHEACHFEVQPVNSKIQIYIAVVVISNTFFQLQELVKKIIKKDLNYYPKKLPEGYNFAVPLRAPPVFA